MTIGTIARHTGTVFSVLLISACAETNTLSPDARAVNARAGYEPGTAQRQYGTPITLGNGKVRSYVVTDHRSRTPLEIGVALDDAAFASLPTDMRMLHLALPPSAPAPYTFVMFDWNPDGHPPVGTYTVPHFDFHFYTMDEADVMRINPSNPDFNQEAANMPPAALVPQFYVLPPAPLSELVVPNMGIHWSDLRSPELRPPTAPGYAPFSKTFIYGSWNGRFTFLEPMITRAFLEQLEGTMSIDIPQSSNMAAAFMASGWYPARYTITHDPQAREFRVALTGLQWQQQ